MKRASTRHSRSRQTLIYLLIAALLYEMLVWRVLTLAAPPEPPPTWAQPAAMAIRQVSPTTGAQSQPNFLSNLDCSLMTYRLVASSTMQTGCFTETAFGLVDSDSDTVIFNGTDEGLPLLAYGPHDTLAPWPSAGALLALSTASTGGSYIHLYKNPLVHLDDQRNALLQLTAKKLNVAADLTLTDQLGQPLLVNPQTLAFSDGGSWLVAESLNGVFVRINLATLDAIAFGSSFGAQGSPGLLNSSVAVSDDGQYVAIYNQVAESFKVYDLGACSGSCPSYDYIGFIKQKISGLQSVRHIRFVNQGLLSFEVVTAKAEDGGIYELAPSASIGSLIDYLGLGDSYTSGEGAFDYLAGTDTNANHCHLSARSYPLLLTHDLFTSRGGHSVACSGAVIHDVQTTAKDYAGQIDDGTTYEKLQKDQPALLASVMTNFLPGYIAQQKFVQQYQPAITTVSVGGNDVGFGDILAQCVLPHASRHLSKNTCFSTYEDRQELVTLINRTIPRWTRLFNQLKHEAPGTRLYAIGYPSIASDLGSCGLNVQLSQSELEFAEELIVYLNSAIQAAVDHAGIVYVDISQALVGHRLCEASSANIAVNGLTAGKDDGVLGINFFGRESYHPNALGQTLIEQAILHATHNLTALPPSPAKPPDNQKLLTAPKTGRQTSQRVPAKLAPRVAKKGRAARVKTKSTGLKARSPYKVHLGGQDGPVIGSGTTDDTGDVDTTVTIPADTESGASTIDVIGDNQTDEPTDVTQPVYVPDSDSDADGDGLDDTTDSCPAAINSGVDADNDGVDDVCDGYIGPATGPGSSGFTPGPTSACLSINLPTGSDGRPLAPAKLTIAASLDKKRTLGRATTSPFRPRLERRLASSNAHQANRFPHTSRHKPFDWHRWLKLSLLIWLVLITLGAWLDNKIGRHQLAYT